jgi:RNA polymerase sigma-70 factor (ECF subfamily)
MHTPAGLDDRFGALYEAHRRRINRHLHAMLGDADEAAELTQETFLRAYRAFGSFVRDADGNAGAWFARIATNVGRDRLRRRRRFQVVPWDFAVLDLPSLRRGDDPEATLLDGEARRAAPLALRALTPTSRRVLLLHERDGLSYAAIGERLGITAGAVKALIFRARRQLRACDLR